MQIPDVVTRDASIYAHVSIINLIRNLLTKHHLTVMSNQACKVPSTSHLDDMTISVFKPSIPSGSFGLVP
jgi:hypothetical protein